MSRLYVAATVLCLSVAPTPLRAQGSGSFTAALNGVQKVVPGGRLVLGRAENGKWGFYFWYKGRLWEIEWQNNMVVRNEAVANPSAGSNVGQDVLDAVRNYSGAKLPYARYLDIASRRAGGAEPQQIAVRLAGGKLVMQVDVGTGSSATSIQIDMATGRVL